MFYLFILMVLKERALSWGVFPILEPFLKDWANKNGIHLVQCTKDDFKDLDMLFGDISVIIFGMNTFLLKKSLELSLRYYIIKEE